MEKKNEWALKMWKTMKQDGHLISEEAAVLTIVAEAERRLKCLADPYEYIKQKTEEGIVVVIRPQNEKEMVNAPYLQLFSRDPEDNFIESHLTTNLSWAIESLCEMKKVESIPEAFNKNFVRFEHYITPMRDIPKCLLW